MRSQRRQCLTGPVRPGVVRIVGWFLAGASRMFLNWMRSVMTRKPQPLAGGRRIRRRGAGSRPQVRRLEDRLAPATLLALNATGTALLRFDSSNPAAVVTTGVTGLNAGEALQGIDFRPATGQLFGLGVTG